QVQVPDGDRGGDDDQAQEDPPDAPADFGTEHGGALVIHLFGVVGRLVWLVAVVPGQRVAAGVRAGGRRRDGIDLLDPDDAAGLVGSICGVDAVFGHGVLHGAHARRTPGVPPG